MTKYKIDGVVVDTDKAKKCWAEDTRWNGNNHISVNTGSQWNHECLYLSSKGRYYLESWSDWQGTTPMAKFISDEQAAQWLLRNEHVLPKDLKQYEEDISE